MIHKSLMTLDIAGASCGHGGLRHCEEDQAGAVCPARNIQDRRKPGEQEERRKILKIQFDRENFGLNYEEKIESSLIQ